MLVRLNRGRHWVNTGDTTRRRRRRTGRRRPRRRGLWRIADELLLLLLLLTLRLLPEVALVLSLHERVAERLVTYEMKWRDKSAIT